MKIPYRVFPDRLAGHLYSAVLNVSVALPMPMAPRSKRFEAIIDSGATRCMFHADLARHLGLNLKSGHLETPLGIGGLEEVWVHEVCLYVPGGPVKIHAAFKENLPVAGLLGMSGFFEHFMVTFIQPALVCEIERIQTA